MKYTVKYSQFRKQYLVVNTDTGTMQSAWKQLLEARNVARLLNRS